jgi:hypothetical protein
VDRRPSRRVEVEGQAASAKRVDGTLATRLMQAGVGHALPAGDRPRGQEMGH